MPYIQITYTAPPSVWVKVSDEDAADPDYYGDVFDTIISNADCEVDYSSPVDELPAGVAKADRDITR